MSQRVTGRRREARRVQREEPDPYGRASFTRSPFQAQEALPLTAAGFLGLLKAINNFDPGIGESLAAYALPCISGEIKRHFRDPATVS